MLKLGNKFYPNKKLQLCYQAYDVTPPKHTLTDFTLLQIKNSRNYQAPSVVGSGLAQAIACVHTQNFPFSQF
jgi:hypothetical protein